MTEKWRKQIQDKIDGLQKPAVELSWLDIDKALEARQTASKATTVQLWTRRIAIAASIALLVVGGGKLAFMNDSETSPTPSTMMASRSKNIDGDKSSTLSAKESLKHKASSSFEHIAKVNASTYAATPTPTYVSATAAALSQNIETKDIYEEREDSKAVTRQIAEKRETQQIAEKGKTRQRAEQRETLQKAKEKQSFDLLATSFDNQQQYAKTKKRSNGFAAELHAQGLLATNNTVNGDMAFIKSHTISYAPAYGNGEMQMAGLAYPLINYTTNEQPGLDYEHDIPIRAGLSVRYNINDRWSITTGVNYTYLHSSTSINDKRHGDQRLHYIGIPLSAGYNVWSNKHLTLYVSAGGTMEKLVKGEQTFNDDKTKIEESRLQWSLQAAAGAEYNVNKTFGLFLEPGINHYFDNHSDVENIYKDKPWSFSLNFGVRINMGR